MGKACLFWLRRVAREGLGHHLLANRLPWRWRSVSLLKKEAGSTQKPPLSHPPQNLLLHVGFEKAHTKSLPRVA